MIYTLPRGGRTFHISCRMPGSPSLTSREEFSRMYARTCEASASRRRPSLDLVGAAHDRPKKSTETDMSTWKPCARSECKKRALIPVKLLRLCRLVHHEAALIPYKENFLIFDDGHDDQKFRHDSFVRSFGEEQRGAIANAAIANVHRYQLPMLASMMTGLKRLWLEYESFKSKDGAIRVLMRGLEELDDERLAFLCKMKLQGAAISIWLPELNQRWMPSQPGMLSERDKAALRFERHLLDHIQVSEVDGQGEEGVEEEAGSG